MRRLDGLDPALLIGADGTDTDTRLRRGRLIGRADRRDLGRENRRIDGVGVEPEARAMRLQRCRQVVATFRVCFSWRVTSPLLTPRAISMMSRARRTSRWGLVSRRIIRSRIARWRSVRTIGVGRGPGKVSPCNQVIDLKLFHNIPSISGDVY